MIHVVQFLHSSLDHEVKMKSQFMHACYSVDQMLSGLITLCPVRGPVASRGKYKCRYAWRSLILLLWDTCSQFVYVIACFSVVFGINSTSGTG